MNYLNNNARFDVNAILDGSHNFENVISGAAQTFTFGHSPFNFALGNARITINTS